jgi:hypothetical protein
MDPINLSEERAARFRVALDAYQAAIDNRAPRATLDKLAADLIRYSAPGHGANIIKAMPSARFFQNLNQERH